MFTREGNDVNWRERNRAARKTYGVQPWFTVFYKPSMGSSIIMEFLRPRYFKCRFSVFHYTVSEGPKELHPGLCRVLHRRPFTIVVKFRARTRQTEKNKTTLDSGDVPLKREPVTGGVWPVRERVASPSDVMELGNSSKKVVV